MKKSMLLFVLPLFFLGCREPKKDVPQSSSVTDATKTEYRKDQFRRFTFFIEADSTKAADIFRAVDWKKIGDTHKEIRAASVYQRGNGYFLVFDTAPDLDSKHLAVFLREYRATKDLIGQLEDKGIQFPGNNQVLERMYKLEQKNIYSAEEGQLKHDIGEYKRFVWTLLLQEDPKLMAEYKRIHSMGQAWPQITENMKHIGVRDMEIYLHGTRAILIMDTRPDFDLDVEGPKWQKMPRESEWQEYVAKFQRTRPGSGIREKWLDMVPL